MGMMTGECVGVWDRKFVLVVVVKELGESVG
jgi:hypothetical protein